MRRVVLDVGVVISGVLSGAGPPARILDAWRDGAFDLVVSPRWLEELERVLARPKIARYVDVPSAADLVTAIRVQAVLVDDPPPVSGLTPDPGDDYLVSLAREASAVTIISGDGHLTGLVDPQPPVLTPRAFADRLDDA